VAVVGVAVALLAGCAGRRIEGGVFRSPKGYHVTIPGADWMLVDSSRADLELRHRGGAAGMLANATCTAAARRRSARVLMRQLTAGLRDRALLERGEVALDGRLASRTVIEAGGGEGRVRIESYVLAGDRCVYDLIYAAPAEAFGAWRGDFERFIETFATE
jgi:hypothetical protein